MKIEPKVIYFSTLTWCFFVIGRDEESWPVPIIHIISKRNDSANFILLCTIHNWVSILFNFSPLGSEIILKLLVK